MSVQKRRRLLVIGSGVALCLGGLGAAWSKREGIRRRFITPALDNWFGARLSRQTAPLSGAELHTVLAFAECLYPSQTEGQQRELHAVVTRWSNERTMEDGLHPLYAAGVRALDELAMTRGVAGGFAGLAPHERLQLLVSLDQAPGEHGLLSAPGQALRRLQQRETRQLISLLRRDLIKGVYSSRLGWLLTGQRHTWPGVPGDPASAASPPST